MKVPAKCSVTKPTALKGASQELVGTRSGPSGRPACPGSLSKPPPAQGNCILGEQGERALSHTQPVLAQVPLCQALCSDSTAQTLGAGHRGPSVPLPAHGRGAPTLRVRVGSSARWKTDLSASSPVTPCSGSEGKGPLRSFATTQPCIVEEMRSFKQTGKGGVRIYTRNVCFRGHMM